MKGSMGFGLLLAGGLFLWNPVVGVTDLLPDFFGYLLLFLGVAKLADLHDDLAEAQKAFRSMLWVGLLQVAAALLVRLLLQGGEENANRYDEPVWVLVFTFAFLVLEWYLMLPAWKKFFHGLSELAELHGGEAVLRERGGKNAFERLFSLTRCFVIVRSLMSLLPELTVLTAIEQGAEEPHFAHDWFPYLTMFRSLAVMVGLVIGLIWVIRFCGLMDAAKKDTAWVETLARAYGEEILPDVGLRLNRRVKAAFGFFRAGILLCINLTVLYREMLPDWGAAALLLVGGLVLGDLLPRQKGFRFACGGVLGAGLLRAFFNLRYLGAGNVPEDARHLPAAFEAYLPVRVLHWITGMLTLVMILLFLRQLSRLIGQHTAVTYADDPVLSASATERLHKRLRRRMLPVGIAWGLATALKILEIEMQPSYGWFWLLQVAASLAAALLLIALLGDVEEQIADRYPTKRRV